MIAELKQMTKNLGVVFSKNSPHILTGIGCTGLLTTAILASTASFQASRILDGEGYYFGQLTTKEAAALVWTKYIPAAAIGVVSIACIIGANKVNASRNAALAAAYTLTDTAFREYKGKVIEQIGANREIKVRDDIAKDRVAKSPEGDRTVLITGNGNVLCYDMLSDRYFRSSAEKIRQQVLDLNYELMNDMWLDLNDLYYAIGLPSTKLGQQMGFSLEKGQIEIEFSSTLSPEGEPCLAIDVPVYPRDRR